MIGRQRGAAFLIVLWLLGLLAIMLGAFVLLARSERLQARQLFAGSQARYAAEAGVNRAAYSMSLADPLQRWVPDGRPYAFEFDGIQVEVAIVDETGKIDLNVADPELLSRYFQVHGLAMEEATALAAAIVDWRDPDDLVTLNGAEIEAYEQEGRDYGPTNASFNLLSELQQVLGMDYELYRRVAPGLTLYSGQPTPNPAFAPSQVLQALPGMDPTLAEMTLAARTAYDPRAGGQPGLLPDGTPLVVTAGSGTYSIASRARLPNGAWAELDTVIRLSADPASGLAFTVLRWQDGAML